MRTLKIVGQEAEHFAWNPSPRTLLRKTALAFAKQLLTLPLLLFVPAWSLDFWQAWLFALVYIASAVLTTAYFLKHDPNLIERRLRAGPSAEKRRSRKIVRTLAMVFFVPLLAFPGFDHRFHWSTVPPLLSIASDFFIALCFFLFFLVVRENSFASATIEISPHQKVVPTGPYRLVRHPMYSTALVMLPFIPLALGSYWSLLFFPPLFALIVWRLLDEETFLSKNLPGYDEYRRHTRYRLIPFLW